MARQDYATMAQAVEGLRRRGFTAEFSYNEETGRITADGHSFTGRDLTIVEHHRFEGVSDPDDSSVLYALQAADGTKGLLVDAYGAYANSKIAKILKDVEDRHGGEEQPAA
jgi:hypothetical protein